MRNSRKEKFLSSFLKMKKFSLSKGRRLLLCFLILSGLLMQVPVLGQNMKQDSRVTLTMKNTSIERILREIERQTDYRFLYNNQLVDVDKKVNVAVQDASTESVLKQLFPGNKISYQIKGKQIILSPSEVLNNVSAQQRDATPQTRTVSGLVKSENGEALPGVTIIVPSTNRGLITDVDGRFSIDLKPNETELRVSYIGMQSELISVVGKSNLEIVLKDETKYLDEVVVTGYQTISRERATGSYALIRSEQLDKPSTSLEQSIIGNVAGVQMVGKGYADERKDEIIIRGLTSLGANSNPLIIVDGFAIEGTLSSINPNDVESITILKDAAAASIWGARSANGVIVVTTKSAKKDKLNVELNSFVRFSGKMDLDYANPLASSAETIEYEKMGFDTNFFNRGNLLGNNYSSAIYDMYGAKIYSQAVTAMNENRLGFLNGSLDAELARLASLNNKQQIKDHLLNAPFTQQHNLSISGQGDKMSNIVTLMFDSNESPYQGNDNQRYTLNYRTNVALYKWLDIHVSSMYQYDKSKGNGLSLGEIQRLSPYDMLLGENGEYLHTPFDIYLPVIQRYVTDQNIDFPYSDWTYNPLREIKGRDLTNKSSYGRIQAGLDFKLLKGLNFNTKYQYEIMESSSKNLYSEDTYQVRKNANYNSYWNGDPVTPVQHNVAKGMGISEASSSLKSWNFRNQVDFNRTFGERHSITALVGTELSKRIEEGTTNPIIYGYNDDLLSITPPPSGINTPATPLYNMFGGTAYIEYPIARRVYFVDKYFSVYANAAYTLDNKYSISGSYRTDASNLISSDPSIRYSPFWSVGLSWHISSEKFMQQTSGWLDKLTLRTTYGLNGNVNKSTSVEPLIDIWGQNPSTGTGYGIISNYGNPNLRWEKTGALNVSLDFAVLKNRLYGKIEYYNKQGRDLISSVALANVYGTATQSINAVEMYNRGLEVTLGSALQYNKFSWSGNLSFSYNKNKITRLFKDRATLANRIYGPGSGWEFAEGYDAHTLWAFKYGGIQNIAGIDQVAIVDKNNENPRAMTSANTSFDSSDYLVSAGTSTPPVVMGLNSIFKYEDLSLSFILSGYFGHKFKRTGFNYPEMRSGNGNINKFYQEVKNADPNKIAPLPIDGMYPSSFSGYAPHLDYLYVSASNIRIQEINLNYNLPRNLVSRLGLGALSVYCQLNNVGVILFNDYGEDPIYPMGTYKPRISYTLGTKINF